MYSFIDILLMTHPGKAGRLIIYTSSSAARSMCVFELVQESQCLHKPVSLRRTKLPLYT